MATQSMQARGGFPGMVGGLRAFAGGMGFILKTPSVWGYALVPGLLVFILAVSLGTLGIWGSLRLTDALLDTPASPWAHAGGWLLTAVLAAAALVAALLLALCLAQPLSGFALEAIVCAQECALTGHTSPQPGMLASMLRALSVALVTLAMGGSVFMGLLVVNLLFPPAMVVTLPLKFVICAWLLAWDFLDYPLGLRGLGVRARLHWVSRNLSAFSAFGAAWAVVLVVPGLALLLLPMGVAGATQLVLEEERQRGEETIPTAQAVKPRRPVRPR